jgi:hypothetical protein
MLRDILSETVEVEMDVVIEPSEAQIAAAKEAGEAAPEKRTVKRTVEQLLAEWIVEQCVDLGRAKRTAELKN